MNIYDITKKYQSLLETIIEQDGEITEAQNELLELSSNDFISKSKDYAGLIKTLEDNNITIKREMDRLKHLSTVNDNLLKRLKDNLKNALIELDIDEVKAGVHKISFRKSTRVNIINEESIPNKYKIIKQNIVVDKKALKKDLATKKIKGAELLNIKNIQIK